MGIDAEMLVRVPRLLRPEDVRRESVKMACAFGASEFYIYRPGNASWMPEGRHALEIVEEYEQDGPTIKPSPGETFVRVSLATRYYGPGYERGDLPLILAVARWLNTTFRPCEVWYGGDSSGVCAEPLDDEALWEHFISSKGRAYFGNSDFMGPGGWTGKGGAVHCDFCNMDATANMAGGDKTGHYCNGCGQHWLLFGDGRIEECDKNYGRTLPN